jgi:hypothetical protein
MPGFQPHTLDLAACRVQIDDLKKLLDGSDDIGESDAG